MGISDSRVKRISTYLNQPAEISQRPWIIVVTASIAVCFVLLFLQPFGLMSIELPKRWFLIAGFTLITALSTTITGYLFPMIFRQFYAPQRWTIWKNILNNIVIILFITVWNTLFDWGAGRNFSGPLLPLLYAYTLATMIVGVIPAIMSSFIVRNGALKQNLIAAQEINRANRAYNDSYYNSSNNNALKNKDIRHTENADSQNTGANRDSVILSGNTKESFKLNPANIIYIEAYGNYIKVVYLSESKKVQKPLRITIARIEEVLALYPYMIRCHRSFIVNISHILVAEGNSHGLRLKLKPDGETIPVSRSYVTDTLLRFRGLSQ